MRSAFAPPFAPSFVPPLFAPPSLNFRGCSINVYTGPVMTSESFQHSNMLNFGLTPDDLENLAKFLCMHFCIVVQHAVLCILAGKCFSCEN